MSPWNGITENGDGEEVGVRIVKIQLPAVGSKRWTAAPGAPLAVPSLVT